MTHFHATFRDYTAPTGWRLSNALKALNVTTEPFDHIRNKGADGYSYDRVLAINPEPGIWSVPIIAAHELAHIVLGHTEFVSTLEVNKIGPWAIPHAQFELEAHTVAKAVAFGLELSAEDFPRHLVDRYIDSCKSDAPPLTNRDAVRLCRAVLDILAAGAPVIIDSEVIG